MQFASDNAGPVHPRVMDALMRANEGHAPSYGADAFTGRAVEALRATLEAQAAEVFLVATGTAANALLLAAMTAPWETVFCARTAHIEEDECGAPEFYSGGAKLTLLEAPDGKIAPQTLEAALREAAGRGVHQVQPGPVSLTQVTEKGTLYSLDELRALCDIAHAHGRRVHMDGARFANAVAALGCSPAEASWRAGVDALSFGGTKNGLMGAEAAVIFDPALARDLAFRRKRGAHLFSKHRYLAAQIGAALEDGLWLQMAGAANAAAARLEAGLAATGKVEMLHPREANILFAAWPRAIHQRLKAAGAAYHLSGDLREGDPAEMLPARLVCDWSARPADTDAFLALF
ncbi:threonine aldolase family protein [Mangrovicoccus algicola]|uniref:Low specificity L-threonine aldolase n=1 Tax=Mangrovicoccus algicola TaxID=2771008 RepID=A0A8J6Z4M0_9RHOB|nr:beta-eliminating lyase-related protein [Mangrovicoccus algicola]MBE3637539.1 low specificity L-threonine aldolase [Mangrovicoccus algicola]